MKDFQLVENQEAGGEEDEEGGIEFEEADIDDICKPFALHPCLKRQPLMAYAETVGLVFCIYTECIQLSSVHRAFSFLHVIWSIIAWALSCLLPALCGIQKNGENEIGQLSNIT